mmetsp:Transcript_28310/g.92416  ORF Transcript_28310/g.92416 Transcript_28310/m.92416 type:complete len:548 (+) Transcript_28310:17-1660(+)
MMNARGIPSAVRGSSSTRARGRVASQAASTGTTTTDTAAWRKQYAPEKGKYTLPIYRGNYKATREECSGTKLVVDGELPEGFPNGVYVRNGPNSYFDPMIQDVPVLGFARSHWFEGDGFLHAVYFDGGEVTYRGRFVETEGLAKEKKANRALWLPLIDTSPAMTVVDALVNGALHGSASKASANTNVVRHAGRVLALLEGSNPVEVDEQTLETIGEHDFGGGLGAGGCTAHPKLDPVTNELVFFAYLQQAPFARVGVVSPEGRVSHTAEIAGLEAMTMMHDFGATRTNTVLIDVPLNLKPERLFDGDAIIAFEKGKRLRFGILPRFGQPSEVRWCEAEPGMIFHTVNAWDEGDEVVVVAMRADEATILPPSDSEANYREWFDSRFLTGISNVCSLHEYRINAATGVVTERPIKSPRGLMEFPKINPRFACSKSRFAYCLGLDVEESRLTGAPLYNCVVKTDLDEAGKGAELRFASGVHCSEPEFVPREGAEDEDDGWVVCFTHDHHTGESGFAVADARNLEAGPVATFNLPTRVPFGLHGAFFPKEA